MINLPSNWSQITYKQFIELKDIDTTEHIFLQHINLLSILTNTNSTDSIWEEMDINELKVFINKISWINSLPTINLLDKIEGYSLKPNESLTLGEYIDLDYYFSNDYMLNLPKIASIYYRHYKHDEYGNMILEPYDNIDIEKRALDFSEGSIIEILPLINYFNDYKTKIYNNSNHLFNPLVNDEDLDDEDLNDPITLQEIEKEKTQSEWNWVNILHNLSNGDITKYDTILNMSFISILNQLTFRKLFSL